MNYQIKYLEFVQNRQTFLIAVMSFGCIDNFGEVLVYGQNNDGYQRKPEPKHYNKIRDYILNNLNNFILPTSIVLGLDRQDLKKISKKSADNMFLDLDSNKIKSKILRIVDGQHRIFGLREASKNNSSINDFLLPVIILITEQNKRSIELSIFSDINSKAKRVKIDLIKLAEFDYRLKEESINSKNIVDHICIKTAFILKEDREKSVWHNAIKFDIHNELILGIVGVNSFMESIQPLIRFYMREHIFHLGSNHSILLKYVDSAGASVADFLFTCWDDYIKSKWPDAFGTEQIGIDIDEELKTFYYKKDYYIQKTFGVKAINGLVGDIYKQNNGSFSKSLVAIKSRISKSLITNKHWKVGGPFSGFSSESGVNKVKKMI
jgi:DGQHR domain-containing protein